jgi:hypothetical protein
MQTMPNASIADARFLKVKKDSFIKYQNKTGITTKESEKM